MRECICSYSHARACKHAHELARVHFCNTDVHARALTRAHVRTSAQTQTCTHLRPYACAARKHVIVPVRVCAARMRACARSCKEGVKRTRTCRHTHGRDSQACGRTQMLALARVSTHSPTRRHPRASFYMQHGCAQTRGGAGASAHVYRTDVGVRKLTWARQQGVRTNTHAGTRTHARARVCKCSHSHTRASTPAHELARVHMCAMCVHMCNQRLYTRTRIRTHAHKSPFEHRRAHVDTWTSRREYA